MKERRNSYASGHAPGPVARATGTSLHRQLFVVLRDEIARGLYPSGMLPKEETLGERFGVSRITVRRALMELTALGLLDRQRGRGTFIRELPSSVREGPNLDLIDGLRDSVQATRAVVLELSRSIPPADVARALQLQPSALGMHVVRLRSIDGNPYMLTDAWVPASLARKVTLAALRQRPLYALLAERGVQFGRVIQQITAEAANPRCAMLLQTEVGAPLLKVTRLLHDGDAQPVQHLTALLTPERSSMLMEISGDTVNTLSAGQFVNHVQATAAMQRSGAN